MSPPRYACSCAHEYAREHISGQETVGDPQHPRTHYAWSTDLFVDNDGQVYVFAVALICAVDGFNSSINSVINFVFILYVRLR